MQLLLTSIFLTISLFGFTQTPTWVSKKQVDLSFFLVEKPHLSKVQCFEVTYLSDSLLVKGLILEPKANPDLGHPSIIFNRGGNRTFATLSPEMLITVLGKVASEGYVVTATNYRWEDEFGGADTNDVLNLLQITKNLPNVDSTRIGMMGWSRGVMMTCLALRGSHQIKTAVLVSGAPNLFNTLDERPILEEYVFSKYIPNYFETKKESLIARSPHFWTEKLNRNSSLLMLNGSQDRHVDYRQTERFSARLDSIQFPHEFHIYETTHSFSNMRVQLDSILLDWFDRKLKPKARRVAITIDDVPNTRTFTNNNFSSKLLQELDSLSIPITIFINEGLIFRKDSVKNKELFDNWMKRSYVTPGNHTYSHFRYSEVGYNSFTEDVLKGEILSQEMAAKHGKDLKYFRFPYNDLGTDSSEHAQILNFLDDHNYVLTPFTIETSDWMFNSIYKKYLKIGDSVKAREIGQMYVDETIRSFAFFDSLTQHQNGRNVDQIYLCHDNRLNEDYLPELIERLRVEGYDFISLNDALKDPIYEKENSYWKKWGITWCYRWMTSAERKRWMNLEPNLGGIEGIFQNENE